MQIYFTAFGMAVMVGNFFSGKSLTAPSPFLLGAMQNFSANTFPVKAKKFKERDAYQNIRTNGLFDNLLKPLKQIIHYGVSAVLFGGLAGFCAFQLHCSWVAFTVQYCRIGIVI
ncbi:MAG: hypothetical protein Q3974_07675 [Rothia sp. (in: high G+C Gram-positive bacteria)]|nr:hypothetical protein [Rothia sp. (in: high G+C Gram-positive bacteria)]